MFTMRASCSDCGHNYGKVTRKGGQAIVNCAICDKYQYAAPKKELGEAPSSLHDRPEIRPKRRVRLFTRDGFRCVVCGRSCSDTELDIGHLISVQEGRGIGMTDIELWADENLATFCRQCNAGQGKRSVPVTLMFRLQCIERNRVTQ